MHIIRGDSEVLTMMDDREKSGGDGLLFYGGLPFFSPFRHSKRPYNAKRPVSFVD